MMFLLLHLLLAAVCLCLCVVSFWKTQTIFLINFFASLAVLTLKLNLLTTHLRSKRSNFLPRWWCTIFGEKELIWCRHIINLPSIFSFSCILNNKSNEIHNGKRFFTFPSSQSSEGRKKMCNVQYKCNRFVRTRTWILLRHRRFVIRQESDRLSSAEIPFGTNKLVIHRNVSRFTIIYFPAPTAMCLCGCGKYLSI